MRIKNKIHKAIEFCGYKLQSNQLFEKFLRQRDELLNLYLLDCKKEILQNDSISCIIFSRDRGSQLYSLLNSISLNFNKTECLRIYVLYSHSSEMHKSVYDDVIRLFQFNVDFIKHNGNNRDCLINLLDVIDSEKLFFLCDDDLFINKVVVEDLLKVQPQFEILSLRHHKNLNYCYTLNKKMKVPPLVSGDHNMLSFNWLNLDDDWSDPWSINGQIFSTNEVRVIAKVSDFIAPNSFENELKKFKSYVKNRKGKCFTKAKIINLPANRVQTETNVRYGNVSADHLADMWKKGHVIDIDRFQGLEINSIYFETELPLKLKID